jgi:hypothetical protein
MAASTSTSNDFTILLQKELSNKLGLISAKVLCEYEMLHEAVSEYMAFFFGRGRIGRISDTAKLPFRNMDKV